MGIKVAIASSDGLKIDLHFGQAKEFFIYELQKDAFVQIERRELAVNSGEAALRHRERHCNAGQKQSGGLFLASLRAAVLRRAQGPQGEGHGPREDELSGGFACPGGGGGCGGCGGGTSGPLAPAVELLLDCQAVIAAQIGQNMRRQFERNAISVFDIELPVTQALEKLAAYYSKLGV